MIIECINCNKKFNVDSALIPSDGRQIKCGSCNHTWHYAIEEVIPKAPITNNTENLQLSEIESVQKVADVENKIKDKQPKLQKQNINIVDNNDAIKNISISVFFSYLLVFIISFVALLVLIDTIKSPLINIFPQLEIILFNLFETLKDLKLFIIDLT